MMWKNYLEHPGVEYEIRYKPNDWYEWEVHYGKRKVRGSNTRKWDARSNAKRAARNLVREGTLVEGNVAPCIICGEKSRLGESTCWRELCIKALQKAQKEMENV